MLRNIKRFLAFLLALALVTTTFGSDIASTKVYAVGSEEELDEMSDDDQEDRQPDENLDWESFDDEDNTGDPPAGDPPAGDLLDDDNDDQNLDQDLDDDLDDDFDDDFDDDLDNVDADDSEGDDSDLIEGSNLQLMNVSGGLDLEVPEYTVTYAAGEHGSVNPTSELVKEGEKANGSEATADEGYVFVGWTDADGNTVSTESKLELTNEITANATYTANFEQSDFTVTYVVSGSTYHTQGYSKNDTLSLPQDPFRAGYFFMGWEYEGATITSSNAGEYSVTSDMTLTAKLEEIRIFEAKVNYYYIDPVSGAKVTFDSATIEVEKNNLPASVQSPSSTQVDSDTDYPVYYPSQTEVQITASDIEGFTPSEGNTRVDGAVVIGILEPKEVKYIPFEFEYYFVYVLKDLDGNGYSTLEKVPVKGVANTFITPEVKEFTGAVFERLEADTVTREGQELFVYYTRATYTLQFDANGGEYVDLMTVPYETEVDLTKIKPTYTGHEFKGWYKDKALTKPAGNSIQITEDTMLYAKWEGKNVQYSIVYSIENADDNNYSYLGTVKETAKVDSEVTATKNSKKPTNLDTTNFTFKDSTTETVKADGSTVVNVRYSRNVYTISWNGDVYEGSDGHTATISDTGAGKASISAKYGANVRSAWLTNFNKTFSGKTYAWSFTKDNADKFVTLDVMPSLEGTTHTGNTITIYAFGFSTKKVQILNYWVENYDSQTTKTRNGKTYGLLSSTKVQFNFLYEDTDFPELVGYSKAGVEARYTRKYVSGHFEGFLHWVDGHWEDCDIAATYSWGTDTPSNYELTMNMFYNAAAYPLTFVDHDGKQLSNQQVTLGTSLNNYFATNQAKSVKPVEDAVWDGWYTDAARTNKYAGDNKMPAGLQLYAKYTIPGRTFTFVDPFTGTDEVVKTENVEHGQTVSSYTPETEHTGFTFGGWYVDKNYSARYGFNKPVTENTTVYAKWNQKDISYTVKYVDESGKDVAPSKTVTSTALVHGQKVVEKPAAVVGMLPDSNEKSITLDYEGNEIVFTYKTKPAFIKYTVRFIYLDGDTEVEVAPAQVDKEVPGSFASVTEAAADIDKDFMEDNYPEYADADYYPVENIIVHNFTFTDADNVITFYYQTYAMGKITVNYVDMDGVAIDGVPSITKTLKIGDLFTIDADVKGYVKDRVEDENGNAASSKFAATAEGAVRIVYFKKKLTITANNKEKAYDGEALVSEGVEDVTVEGLKQGHSLASIEYDGSQTLAGTSATTPKNAVISGPTSQNYYAITYVAGNLTVTQIQVVVNIVADKVNEVYNAEEHTAGYKIESISNDAFLEDYIEKPENGSISSTDVTNQKLVLHFGVKEAYVDTFDVTFNVTEGYLIITPAPLVVTTKGGTHVYDGQPFKVEEGEITGWKGNDGGTISNYTGERTHVVEYDENNQPTEYTENEIGEIVPNEGTNMSNYYVEKWNMGKLYVTPRPLTINVTGHTKDENYTGAEFTVSGYDIALPEGADSYGYKLEAEGEEAADFDAPSQESISVTEKAVGNYPLGLEENDPRFVNNNTDFDVTFNVTDGYLNIAQSETVIVKITGNKDTKTFNKTEQSVKGYEISIEKDPTGTYDLSKVSKPSQDDAVASGTSVGTYPMGLGEEGVFTNTDDSYNVDFSITDGELTITQAKITVNIKGNTLDTKYTGELQSISGYEVEILDAEGNETSDFTENDIDGPSQTSAVASGEYASSEPYTMGLTKSQFAAKDTVGFDVTFNVTDGELNIAKRPVKVTITGNTNEAPITYDNTEHSVSGYKVDIDDEDTGLYKETYFVGPAKDSEAATAKRTLAGTTDMTFVTDDFTVDPDNDINDNFDVTFSATPGSITIDPVESITVYVYGENDTVDYNGGLQYIEGFTVKDSEGADIDPTITVELKDGKKARAEGTKASEDPYMMGLKGNYFTATSENYSEIVVEIAEDGWLLINKAERPENLLPSVEGYKDVYDGDQHSIKVDRTTALEDDTFTYTYNGEVKPTAPIATNVKDSVESIVVTVSNPNYLDADLDPVELVITPRPLKVKTNSAWKYYDGYVLTEKKAVFISDEEEKIGFVKNDSATVEAKGEILYAGTTPNEYDADAIQWKAGTDSSNYKVVEDEGLIGTLEIRTRAGGNEFEIIATPVSEKRTYTGAEQTGFAYVLTFPESLPTSEVTGMDAPTIIETMRGMINWIGERINSFGIRAHATEATGSYSDGDRQYNVTANAEVIPVEGIAKDVGNYTLIMDKDTLNEFTVLDKDGVDVSAEFTIIPGTEGELEITPANAIVTTGTSSKVDDGTPLTNSEASITGLLGEDADIVTIVATGIQNGQGSSTNTYEITWGDVNSDNYDITERLGTLTITAGGGGGEDTPGEPTTTITDAPTPAAPAPAPAQAVLGARREEAVNGQAVLGARRARTEDTTDNTSRVFAIVIAAAVVASLVFTKKRKEEQE